MACSSGAWQRHRLSRVGNRQLNAALHRIAVTQLRVPPPPRPSWCGCRRRASPSAASLERCAELLGVDLAAVQEAAAHVEPYLRVDGTRVWSLMQLERQLRPAAYGRVRGGYIAWRRPRATRPQRP